MFLLYFSSICVQAFFRTLTNEVKLFIRLWWLKHVFAFLDYRWCVQLKHNICFTERVTNLVTFTCSFINFEELEGLVCPFPLQTIMVKVSLGSGNLIICFLCRPFSHWSLLFLLCKLLEDIKPALMASNFGELACNYLVNWIPPVCWFIICPLCAAALGLFAFVWHCGSTAYVPMPAVKQAGVPV